VIDCTIKDISFSLCLTCVVFSSTICSCDDVKPWNSHRNSAFVSNLTLINILSTSLKIVLQNHSSRKLYLLNTMVWLDVIRVRAHNLSVLWE
jgi:hypothetical protein